MKMIIESERLWLREFNVHDAEVLFDLNNDPEVIRYTGDAAFESVEATRKFIEAYDQYEKK